MNEKLTKEECLSILNRYKDWNYGQRSVALNFGAIRTVEDEIYDARRQLILKATKRLVDLI